MNNTRSRKWQLTFNNPEEHGMSREIIKVLLWNFKINYWCMCDEVGESGTRHTHLFIQSKNAISFDSLKSKFPSAHIEKAQGTAQENRDYIRKEGKYENSDKKETNLIETFEEEGILQEEKQGRRNDLEDIFNMIKDGASELEIIEKHPHYMNSSSYQKVRNLLLEEDANKWRPVQVTYMYGETGTGKTSYLVGLLGSYSAFYRVTDYTHPFDGYNGQETILFDEYRSDIPLSSMLNYLDGHPCDLPCRYQNKKAMWKQVYIASNIPLNMQYDGQYIDPQTAQAFKRRINKVLHFETGQEPKEEEVVFR